ncbi:MAG: tRNA-(ms[2]io[6]A)-hydroxylase [Myxococcota bacterium]|jgi:tRNA-(ms[2]io[6]A)-hydroxylase
MLRLRAASPELWLATVLDDFDTFLLDHAAAERKASAVALSLITHYPDRSELVDAMMEIAKEELDHFHQVYKVLAARGLILAKDDKDAYVRELRTLIRTGSDDYFLDRLLIAGIVEARGCERFGLIADGLTDPELASFYKAIAASEARHDEVYTGLARTYFSNDKIDVRLDALLDEEAKIMGGLAIRAALH